jgi:omega-6 fatty acid desaturase (delta-12 desaturase)
MITYLHHTDPDLPHYRGKAWNFQRGAAATVDRNFLGWQGRFFLHDVAHFHVIHHVSCYTITPLDACSRQVTSSSRRCLSVSFAHSKRYNQVTNDCVDHGPEATQYLKAFIGHHYAYSDKPVFKSLWDSYNKCQFVEDKGKAIFQPLTRP